MSGNDWDADDSTRVLDYFDETQPDAAGFARALIARGGTITELWGPLQMSVWNLVIERGAWRVTLHSERGFGDWPVVSARTEADPREARRYPAGLVVFVWARAHEVPFRVDRVEGFNHDLAAHGCDAMDWLDSAGPGMLDGAYAEWARQPHISTELPADAQAEMWAAAGAAMDAAIDGASDATE